MALKAASSPPAEKSITPIFEVSIPSKMSGFISVILMPVRYLMTTGLVLVGFLGAFM